MSGTYHNTLDPQILTLKDCGEDPITCTDLTEGVKIDKTIYDARCKRLPADGVEIHTESIGLIAKNVNKVFCGLCGLCGIERG